MEIRELITQIIEFAESLEEQKQKQLMCLCSNLLYKLYKERENII